MITTRYVLVAFVAGISWLLTADAALLSVPGDGWSTFDVSPLLPEAAPYRTPAHPSDELFNAIALSRALRTPADIADAIKIHVGSPNVSAHQHLFPSGKISS